MKKGSVRNIVTELLSDNWYTLNNITFDYEKEDGTWETQSRETYDRGNGAAILLYNKDKGTVVLTKQFRMPTYLNGNSDGMMIEVCAGLLDGDHPEDCIKKEVEEETGYRVSEVHKVMEAFSSPGAVTEVLFYFIATYEDSMKVSDGGGVDSESENIEVLEMKFEKALNMIKTGEIKDAKSIILLQYAQINGLLDQ